MIDLTNFTLTFRDVGFLLLSGGMFLIIVLIPVIMLLERIRNRKYDREYGIISCISFAISLIGAVVLGWTAFVQKDISDAFIAIFFTGYFIIMLRQAWDMALGKNEEDSKKD